MLTNLNSMTRSLKRLTRTNTNEPRQIRVHQCPFAVHPTGPDWVGTTNKRESTRMVLLKFASISVHSRLFQPAQTGLEPRINANRHEWVSLKFASISVHSRLFQPAQTGSEP